MTIQKTPLPDYILIIGRRWFQRSYGNTYHTAEIIIDGNTVHKTPMQYGYGDAYTDTAFRWLVESGIIPAPPERESHFSWIRDKLRIAYAYQAIDVSRQKDL